MCRLGRARVYGMFGSKPSALLFVLLAVAGFAFVADASADELAEANALVLADPANADLNLNYALIAEGQGKYRLALAAYERILLNDPDNNAAKRGLIRVRRIIQPPTTRKFVEVGVKGESNAEHVPDPGQFDFLGFGRLRITDERTLGETRWRSEATLYGEAHSEADSLNYASAFGSIGPIFDLGASMLSLRPAIGGGVGVLDGDFYYADVNASATFEGYLEGAFEWARLRVGYRQYGEDWTSDNGFYLDAAARVTKANVLVENDAVTFAPMIRWNEIEGTFNDNVDDFSPGRYVYGGAVLSYFRSLNDLMTVGASIGLYDRYFLVDTAPDGDNRNDLTVTPGVTVLFKDVFGPQTGLRFKYDFEYNDSNDPAHDYQNHILGLSVIARR